MTTKQRLLYISSETTHPASPVLSMAIYEPTIGSITQIDPKNSIPIYESVHEAQIDGWRVIHFPDQKNPVRQEVVNRYIKGASTRNKEVYVF